jgi:hypothetical protein
MELRAASDALVMFAAMSRLRVDASFAVNEISRVVVACSATAAAIF